MSEELVFEDISPTEIPITIGKEKYVLREASGEAAAKWRGTLFKDTKLDANGRPVTSAEAVADSEISLLSLCLYKADESGRIVLGQDGEPDPKTLVPAKVIRKWKYQIVSKLFGTAQRISGLDQKETKASLVEKMSRLKEQMAEIDKNKDDEETHLKNSLSLTTAGSE